MRLKFTEEGNMLVVDKDIEIYCKDCPHETSGQDKQYYYCEAGKCLICSRCLMSKQQKRHGTGRALNDTVHTDFLIHTLKVRGEK